MHKSKLNELCQKNRWGSPMYSFIKDGEEHNPDFRGSVVVNGFTFVSQSIFKSSKHACNDAAQQALNHFTTFTRYSIYCGHADYQKAEGFHHDFIICPKQAPKPAQELDTADVVIRGVRTLANRIYHPLKAQGYVTSTR